MTLPGQGRLLGDVTEETQTQESIQLPGQGRLIEDTQTEESWPQWGGRMASMGASAVVERAAGLPGDIKEGIGNLAIKVYENSSLGLDEESMKAGFDPDKSFFESFVVENPLFGGGSKKDSEAKREAPQWIKDALFGGPGMKEMSGLSPPTSTELRKGIGEATGGYTEPKTQPERIYRQFVSDMTDLTMVPAKFKMSIPRRAGVALGSELLGETAKAISGKESDKQKVKAGSMFLLSILNPGGAKNHVGTMYEEVRQAIPQDARGSVGSASQKLHNFQKQTMRSNIDTKSTSAVMKDANSIEELFIHYDGKPPIHALLDAKQRINENRGSFYATTATGMERKTGRNLYGELMGVVDDAIENALNSVPDFNQSHVLETFKDANQAWSTLHEASRASGVVKKLIPSRMRGSAMAAIFEVGFLHPSATMKLAGAGAAGAGIVSGARVLNQVMKSPILRKYYLDTTKHALAGNSRATLESWNKLNDAWELEEKNKKSRSKKN